MAGMFNYKYGQFSVLYLNFGYIIYSIINLTKNNKNLTRLNIVILRIYVLDYSIHT